MSRVRLASKLHWPPLKVFLRLSRSRRSARLANADSLRTRPCTAGCYDRAGGHDNEACTVSFGCDVLCQDIVILSGQGDLQTSWTFQWPATGTRGPASFDGVIDGGTAQFAAAHGTFHAAALPDGDIQITAMIDAGQR